MDAFRSKQTALAPELLEIITSAWTEYVQSKVVKGLLDTDKPLPGNERVAWAKLVQQFDAADKVWKQECLKRDEKFEMHFSAAVRCESDFVVLCLATC